MSNRHRSQNGDDSDQALRDLFAHAAPRPLPPEADADEIRRAVYAEWDAVTGRRVFRRRAAGVAGAAAAAAVVVGVALFVLDTGSGPPLPTVATVERVLGNVEIEGVDQLRVGVAIAQAARVNTHSGQIALRLTDGGSLRLGSQTELTLVASAEAELDAGALYFDSDGAAGPSKFAVKTAYGTLRDIGTQFVARLEAARLEIGVRDGSVELARRTDTIGADAGERVSVPQGAGSVRRDPIGRVGANWSWAEQLAPPFDTDGRQLVDFLSWVARETGRTLMFADPAAERVARETVLKGSIDLPPMQKLAAMMATTDLAFALDAERIVISAK